MTNYPNFTNYGYQIISELGHNRAGGRITYLATEINTQKSVVIKQLFFSQTTSKWSDYDNYQREIDILKGLDYPPIPRYLYSFQTPTGFCLIQEYKNAPSLAISKTWTPQQIKQIAISVLDILKYLQSQIPPIIHRDLKPENILVDDNLNVSLVDFGFARMGGGEIAVSSVVKGTLGFMPPEQIFNRELTPASDLYSLGVTLICLLTHTSSTEAGSLMDDKGKVNFQAKVTHLSDEFIQWLSKLVEPNYKQRFTNAQEALKALIPVTVLRAKNDTYKSKFIPLITGSIFLLSVVAVGWQFLKPQPVVIKPQPVVVADVVDEILMTTNPNSKNNLNRVTLQDKIVYFKVKLNQIKDANSKAICQIIDASGIPVGFGEAETQLSKYKKQVVYQCSYLLNPEIDSFGDWKFQLFLNNKKIIEYPFKIEKYKD